MVPAEDSGCSFFNYGETYWPTRRNPCATKRTAPLSQMGQAVAASTGAYVRHCSQLWGSGAQFPARIQGVSVPGE